MINDRSGHRTNKASFYFYEESKIAKVAEKVEWWLPGWGGETGSSCSKGIKLCTMNNFWRSTVRHGACY